MKIFIVFIIFIFFCEMTVFHSLKYGGLHWLVVQALYPMPMGVMLVQPATKMNIVYCFI